jgi:hypothetical protein
MTRLHFFALTLTMLAASASTSCFDPQHTDEVNAQGPEVNGVGPGPTHRPGQYCRACHAGSGPGKGEFSIAGTVYAVRDGAETQQGVKVILTDATGEVKQTVSNEAGNFYLLIGQWAPVFPVRVLLDDGVNTKEMITTIGRNGSCAFCHYGADNEPSHMPRVFLKSSQ